MVGRAMAFGIANRDDATGLCFRKGLQAGRDPENLWEECLQRPKLLPGPNGHEGATVDVMEQVLKIGVPEDRKALVREVFGNVILTIGNGGVRSELQAKGNGSLRIFAQAKAEHVIKLQEVIEQARLGQPIATITVNGHPISNEAIRNIATEPNTQIRQLRTERLASALALITSMEKLILAQETLAMAMAASSLPISQRTQMGYQLAANNTRIAMLEKRIALVGEFVAPVVTEEAKEYKARRMVSGNAGAGISPQGPRAVRQYESGGNPMGYPQ